jgi:hypothetical protein
MEKKNWKTTQKNNLTNVMLRTGMNVKTPFKKSKINIKIE